MAFFVGKFTDPSLQSQLDQLCIASGAFCKLAPHCSCHCLLPQTLFVITGKDTDGNPTWEDVPIAYTSFFHKYLVSLYWATTTVRRKDVLGGIICLCLRSLEKGEGRLSMSQC